MKQYAAPVAMLFALNGSDILTDSLTQSNELPVIWDID